MVGHNYRHLLVVEDDKINNDNLCSYLDGSFDEISSAYDAHQGWETYKSSYPNIFIVDIELPGFSGLQLIEKIRKSDKSCFIAVLTAYSNQEYLLDAVELKLDAYILKPITSDKIRNFFDKLQEHETNSSDHLTPLGEKLFYDSKSKAVVANNGKINLTNLEILLLELLIYHRGILLSYETIGDSLYEGDEYNFNAIKVLIAKLRKKIPGINIVSTPKIGYTLI